MFGKVLVANRGEIAIRVARTCRRMGIAVAGVHSEADRDALHVRTIGHSVLVGPAPARESYLDIDRIVDAARKVGADAVHPGYGFLSENADFAERLEREGIAFIGPSPQVLRDFGDKAAAKRLAAAAGVPTIPGSDGASADPAVVAAMVRTLGVPVLLKAAAGGGGKGIRVLVSEAGMADAISAAMREGAAAFGDPSLLVERYLPDGRHVEVQILGDGRGEVLHLWERECSLQRRHQKVVEEAPALALPPGLRGAVLEAAVALGRHVRYRALGTVEFLVVGERFHFLEVNPRLQVEHPVTEAVTGLDLVELQIRAAAGVPLPLAQEAVRCDGHAIEARLYAEDPETDFVPATGTLHRLVLPPAPARVDSGVARGSVVTPHYDPMLAKIVAAGPDRQAALDRLRDALAATHVAGIACNLAFLERLVRSPAVAGGVPDTGTIARLPADDAPAPWRAAAGHVAAARALQDLRTDDPARPASDWRATTFWRLGGPGGDRPRRPQFDVEAGGAVLAATVAADGARGERFTVTVGETTFTIALPAMPPAAHASGESPGDSHGSDRSGRAPGVAIDGIVTPLWIGREDGDGDTIWLSDGRHTETVRVRPALARDRAAATGAAAALVAPLTGKVLEVRVAAGDAVEAGQLLVIVESMKMEMRIVAPQAGVATAVAAMVGAMVERGAVLVTVEPAKDAH